MKKFMFGTFLCAICLMFSTFFFVGCGETRSFDEVVKVYSSAVGSSTEFFQNYDVKISYSSKIQQKIISASQDDLYYNLKDDDSSKTAIFVTSLRANVLVVKYFMDWPVENYKKVPSEQMNSLYSNAKALQNSLSELKIQKQAMESASDPDNWVADYRKAFYDAILKFSDFSSQFLYVFEKYVSEDSAPKGRISLAQTRLEFSKKMIETTQLVAKYYIKDSIKKSYKGDDEISSTLISTYRAAVAKFKDIGNVSITDEQEAMLVDSLGKIQKYNSYYYAGMNAAKKILSDHSLADLNEKKIKNTLTDEERVYLNKLKDFIHTYAIMKDYVVSYKDALASVYA